MKLARLISRHSAIILVLALIATVPAAVGFLRTEVNYDILSYLPSSLASMRGEEILDKGYGDASIGMLILEGKSTSDILELKQRIKGVDGVRDVIWTDDILDPSVPTEMLPSALRTGFYSASSTRVIVRFHESSASMRTQKAIGEIREIAGSGAYLSGASPLQKDTQDLAAKETPSYVLLAVLLLVLVLALTMESPLIPFVFLAEIGLAILYNFGTNIILGRISYLTNGLASILQLGVTMDFSIFLLHRYEEERPRYADKRDAMAEAIKRTFLTISGGALTEIAGFLSLCAMDLKIGADIGIVMAKGVVFGLVGTMTILPALLLVLDGPIHRFNHRPLLPRFKKTAAFVSKHDAILSLAFLVLLVPAVYGQLHAKQSYDLTATLPKDMPSVVASEKLQTQYGMVATHFLLIRDDLPPAELREAIERIESVAGVESVLAFEKFAGPLIPDSILPDSIRSIFKQGGRNLLIVNSTYKTSAPETNTQLASLEEIAKSYDEGALLTGEGELTRDLIRIMSVDFKRVDILSIGAVFLIILFIFASFSLPVLLVGGIELAICINLALPFYVGETIPFIASIVIGCVQLGVTIDYAILLVTRFKEEIQKGIERRKAMSLAIESSGRSIATSALTLFAATAGVSLVSQQAILQSLCTMIARGAIISMLIILFVLPSMLVLFEPAVAKTSRNWREPRKPPQGALTKENGTK
jgi:Predicted exporters of the RND superfamily